MFVKKNKMQLFYYRNKFKNKDFIFVDTTEHELDFTLTKRIKEQLGQDIQIIEIRLIEGKYVTFLLTPHNFGVDFEVNNQDYAKQSIEI